MNTKAIGVLLIALLVLCSAARICQAQETLEAKLAKLEAGEKVEQAAPKGSDNPAGQKAATVAKKPTLIERIEALEANQKKMLQTNQGVDTRLARLEQKLQALESSAKQQAAAGQSGPVVDARVAELESKTRQLETQLQEVQAAAKTSGTAQPELGDLAVDVDATYVTKYIWRGYDIFDDHGAFQPSVNVDLFGTGFSVNVWGSIPTGSGNGINALQEYDYTVAYGCSVFEDKPYAMDFGINYIYYDFPKLNRFADTQEVGMSVAWPNLLKLGDIALVPSYYVGQLFPTKSKVHGVAGGFHTLAMSCDVPVPSLLQPDEEQIFSFSSDITYNGGFGIDRAFLRIGERRLDRMILRIQEGVRSHQLVGADQVGLTRLA